MAKVTARAQSNDCVDTRLETEIGSTITLWGLFDAHVDNVKADLDLLKDEIQQMADDPNARVIVGGDFNDMMFAMGDPRLLPSGLASRLRGVDDKITELLNWNVELLWPIRDKIDLFIYGNHESAYEKRHGVNISRLTIDRLNRERGPDAIPIPFGGYGCWKRYYITIPKMNKSVVSTGWIHHGAGGDAPVTKGMIGIARSQTDFGFDWHMSGHIHKATANNAPRLDVYGGFGKGKSIANDRIAVICGTYERNYPLGQKSTFSMEKRHAPAPLGAGKVFLRPRLRKDRSSTLYCKVSYQ